MFIELALPILWGTCIFVSFSLFLFLFFFLFSFSFSLASSLCQQLYKITIWDSAHNVCSESTRYQMCIAQAIIRGTSLNRCLLLAKIVGFIKECKWGEVAECLYLSSTIFTLYCWIPPWSRNLDGVDSMNNADDDPLRNELKNTKIRVRMQKICSKRWEAEIWNLLFSFCLGR